jgi:hypothetical protein
LFIRLINDGTNVATERNSLFKSLSREQLITLIQDLCYLDSDIFLDSVADYILEMFESDTMDWNDMQEYLGLENDFTQQERKLILNDKKLEYFISAEKLGILKMFIKIFNNHISEPLKLIASSVATAVMKKQSSIYLPKLFRISFAQICNNYNFFKFPFPNKSLYSLKTNFATPMNAFIAKIIQRSNENARYLLSLINKTIKNEVDRYPLMLSRFHADSTWWRVYLNKNNYKRGFSSFLKCEALDDNYLNAFKKRKIITNEFLIAFDNRDPIIQTSFDFVISPNIEVRFYRTYISMYHFDLTKCKIPSIFYRFYSVEEWWIKFEEIYEHLIAKAILKEIKIYTFDFFNFFSSKPSVKLFKNQNASKFHLLNVRDHDKIYPEFKEFVKKYMDDNGLIVTSLIINGIPVEVEKDKYYYKYPVSIVKKHLESIIIG